MRRFDLGEQPPQVTYQPWMRTVLLHCMLHALPAMGDGQFLQHAMHHEVKACFGAGQVSGVKVYRAGEQATSDEILLECDFMWAGQQARTWTTPVQTWHGTARPFVPLHPI